MLLGRGVDNEYTVVVRDAVYFGRWAQMFRRKVDSLLCNNQIVRCHTPDGFTSKVQGVWNLFQVS
jgi:hypothetical protein